MANKSTEQNSDNYVQLHWSFLYLQRMFWYCQRKELKWCSIRMTSSQHTH